MKHTLRNFIFSCILLINTSLSGQNKVTNAYFTENKPIIDGNIDDVWDLAPKNSIEQTLVNNEVSNYDLGLEFKILWDFQNLYILAMVSDDTKKYDSGTEYWNDDDLELYIDIGNKKLTYYSTTDYQFNFRWNDSELHSKIESVIFSTRNTENGYITEIKLPWNDLGETNPTLNKLVGFDIQVNDDDDGSTRDSKKSWNATTDYAYQNPSLLGTIKLQQELKIQPYLNEPMISVKHGFFTSPFSTTITSYEPNSKIKYTLDGSNPVNSTTALTVASPATISIDSKSTTGRPLTPCVTLRACAVREGNSSSRAITETYIFLNSVKTQTSLSPGTGWASPNLTNSTRQYIDYGMDTKVVNDVNYKTSFDLALTEIPSISIVTDVKYLFSSDSGIYVNATKHGEGWERPASVELIKPDGSTGFQINGGIRIRGGWSRHNNYPKHGFRCFFRKEYGEAKLSYPLFEEEGVSEYAGFDLRMDQNYAYSNGGEGNIYTGVRDVFSRDTQRDMGQPYTRSRYYHLYVNGMYWGLAQTQERSEADFAESYLGGEKDDYDVIKTELSDNFDRSVGATEGTYDSWKDLYNRCKTGFSSNVSYFSLEAKNEDGTANSTLKKIVDIDNLIDYMMVIFFTGNFDAPVTKYGSNSSPNNFFAIYNRKANEGYKFFAHDNEHTLMYPNLNNPGIGVYEDRVNIAKAGMTEPTYMNFHPQWLHYKLSLNAEYRQRFADRVYKHMFNNGALTVAKCQARFTKRSNQLNNAIIAESARWGDTFSSTPFTRNTNWVPAVNTEINNYFPERHPIVLSQLKTANLYTSLLPPSFAEIDTKILNEKKIVVAGFNLTILNDAQSTVYYTTDGNDPRQIGGSIYANALNSTNAKTNVSITKTTIVKARTYNGSNWSPLHELQLIVEENDYSNLKVTEIHFNPLDSASVNGSELEFIELKNTSNQSINLSGVKISRGIEFSFSTGTIVEAGKHIVLASNAIEFERHYKIKPLGQFFGQLSNQADTIFLCDPSSIIVSIFTYSVNEEPLKFANGYGNSIVSKIPNPQSNTTSSTYWRVSSRIGGSPGRDDDEPTIKPVYINEIMTNAQNANSDFIELYNPNNEEVDVSFWFLTNKKTEAHKWAIPANTIIPALGFSTFSEGHFEKDTFKTSENEYGAFFSLKSTGDDIYLFSANSSGNLTGYVHGFSFEASNPNSSIGRYVNSQGNELFIELEKPTLGAENAQPKIGPLVVSQIMYYPKSGECEFLKITNISEEKIDLFDTNKPLNTWKISAINFEFPPNISLDSGQSLFLVKNGSSIDSFRSKYSISYQTQVFQYYGSLDNKGETLTIKKAGENYISDFIDKIAYIDVDKISYLPVNPWYPEANATGKWLQRNDLFAFGNDANNWDTSSLTNSTIPINEDSPFISIYPNPAHDKLSIELKNETLENCLFQIYSINGRLLYQTVNESKTQFTTININALGLNTGLYILKLSSNKFSEIKKFVISK